MKIQKNNEEIISADFAPGDSKGKATFNRAYIREDKLSDALANLHQMMQIQNDGYWSLLRER